MKTMLQIVRTKLFLGAFLLASAVILAATVPQLRNFVVSVATTTSERQKPGEQKKVAPKIKKQNKSVNVSRVTSGVTLDMNNAFGPTLTSDAPDYWPLSTATFTGDGFAPNEDVVLKVKNLTQPCNTVSADSSYFPWTVTADNYGHFVTTWTVCNCPGDSLRLRAIGQISQDTAYLYFSDNVTALNITSPTTASPATVAAGCNVAITYTYTTNTSGGSADGTATINIKNSGGTVIATGTQLY